MVNAHAIAKIAIAVTGRRRGAISNARSSVMEIGRRAVTICSPPYASYPPAARLSRRYPR
jgi:hypothetical protein